MNVYDARHVYGVFIAFTTIHPRRLVKKQNTFTFPDHHTQ